MFRYLRVEVLDLNRLAREELASRGLNDQGNWIGFDAAKKHHNV